MLQRLCGLETEYAVHYSPDNPQGPRPDADALWHPLVASLQDEVATGRRRGLLSHEVFLENGGAVGIESQNIIEGKTPECRGPSALLSYQRAQDRLLAGTAKRMEERLGVLGFPGRFSLLKNCRDVDGNVYGAQENYDLSIARGSSLAAYRTGLVVVLALAIPSAIVSWGLVLAAVAIGLGVAVPFAILRAASSRWRRGLDRFSERIGIRGFTAERLPELAISILWFPAIMLLSLLTRWFAFRRVRLPLEAFVVSRPIISGAGSLEADGAFTLSEKAPSMRSVVRNWPVSGRCIFDNGNLTKRVAALFAFDWRGIGGLFGRQQRLQLGLSDSNRAQVAEYLRVATTSLLIDMAEAGALIGAPRLKNPIASLRKIVADPSLTTRVPLRGGESVTALELQRRYLTLTRNYLSSAPAAPLEAWTIVKLWARILDALEQRPSDLVGELDWVTKRFLLDTAGKVASAAARKKIDLRYHELGTGYFDRLEARGLTQTLVGSDEVERATHCPPAGSPASLRGELVRRLARSSAGQVDEVRVDWDSVRLKRYGKPMAVRLVSSAVGVEPLAELEIEGELPQASPVPDGGQSLTQTVIASLSRHRGPRVLLAPLPAAVEERARRVVLGPKRAGETLLAVIDLSAWRRRSRLVVLTDRHLCFVDVGKRRSVPLWHVESCAPESIELILHVGGGRTVAIPTTSSTESALVELCTQLALWRRRQEKGATPSRPEPRPREEGSRLTLLDGELE